MIRIGDIYNFYGGLYVKEKDGKCYWAIEDYEGYEWEEISEHLYNALVQHETKRKQLAEADPHHNID